MSNPIPGDDAVLLTAEFRTAITEAAGVLESAAAHNRSKGRTVLAHTQQERADRLRLGLAAGAPAETVKAAPGLLQQFLDAAAADGITAMPKLMAVDATPSPSAEVARDAARLSDSEIDEIAIQHDLYSIQDNGKVSGDTLRDFARDAIAAAMKLQAPAKEGVK